MPLTMKPFRDRNAAAVGAVALLLIALVLAVASQASSLPVIGGGAKYAAEFTEVGGLKKGDDVRLAGVRVGEVSSLDLRGDKVRVTFRMKKDRERLGSQTGASVRIKSLLGTMYVSLEPEGPGTLEKGAVIPASRTKPPYDIVQAFSGLTETTQEIDQDQLAQALKTVSEVAAKTPEEFREAVTNVTALSNNLAERDQEIEALLKNIDGISGVLADRNAEFIKLFEDGTVLFDALTARRDAIHQVLVSVTAMSGEIDKLVVDTRDDLKPALDRLAGVVKVLRQNEANIEAAIAQLPAYYAMVANNGANGPWLDSYIYNLLSILGVEGGL
ncbi:MCE family protein [Aeromicrobium sp. 636]|uniref:MCE family protein n=1 Tax=Aeromicrobium senzhongii TaxID=2663859 RepID=A0A8I0K1L4_9ACTN|nr:MULTISPECIES: MCE family protein [Aeromicrobium]MBC9227676.1 MCE family protein [Aeromicrobium senzhongii]MCQ3999773.1 MCE family protein [Aeromicrobium sp. 636]